MDSPENLVNAIKAESHLVVLGVLLLAALYAARKFMTRKKKPTDTTEQGGEK